MSKERIAIKTPEFVSLQFRLAGLGSRAGAMIIDQFLLVLVNFIILLFLRLTMETSFSNSGSFLFALTILFLFVLQWGYFFISEYFFGGKTVGKKMIGIRVIHDNGHRVTLVSSMIRNLMRIIDMLPGVYFVGIVMVFFHPRHKRIGDLVSGTIVVHERKAKKKKTPVDKAIEARGLSKESLPMTDLNIKGIGTKEWKLLKTYSERVFQMDAHERIELTKKMATILLPKVNLSAEEKTTRELEDTLLALYLVASEEWEYEL